MDELSVSLSIHFCVQFIKPQNYENTKSKKFKNNIGKRENMIYNEITDTYTCANNKELKFIAATTRKAKGNTGWTALSFYSRNEKRIDTFSL